MNDKGISTGAANETGSQSGTALSSRTDAMTSSTFGSRTIEMPPQYLYKYMGKRLDRIGDVLVNQRLHFSAPARFNDPFDCALGLDLRHGATRQDWEDYFCHLVEEDEPDSTPEYRQAKAEDHVNRGCHTVPTFVDDLENGIRQEVKEIGREQGVLCLSSDPKNVMMWANYADNHEGLVMRFDTQNMGDQASGELRCFQVEYGLSFPQLSDYLSALREVKNGDPRAITKLFLCRKSRDWKREQEWRFFSSSPDSFVEFDPPMLSGVIFGQKMPQSIRKLVTAWVRDLNPQPLLLEAEPCLDRFLMAIKTVAGSPPGTAP